MVAATLGLSLGLDDAGPELLLLVASLDPAWAFALATAARQMQPGVESVVEGSTFSLGSPVTEASQWLGFVFVHPFILPEGETGILHTAQGHVSFLQAIPLHQAELDGIRQVDGEARTAEVRAVISDLGEAVFEPSRPSVR